MSQSMTTIGFLSIFVHCLFQQRQVSDCPIILSLFQGSTLLCNPINTEQTWKNSNIHNYKEAFVCSTTCNLLCLTQPGQNLAFLCSEWPRTASGKRSHAEYYHLLPIQLEIIQLLLQFGQSSGSQSEVWGLLGVCKAQPGFLNSVTVVEMTTHLCQCYYIYY